MEDWFDYFERVGNRPNLLVVGSVKDFVTGRSAALDLGCGNFRDSRWLKECGGFERVVAVDPSEEIAAYLHDGIEYHPLRMQDFVISERSYDLIVACNALFYLSRDEVRELIPRAMRGLGSNGVFSFNLLGPRDGWVLKGLERSWFTKDETEELIAPYDSYCATEVELNLTRANDDGKKWHLFSFSLGNVHS